MLFELAIDIAVERMRELTLAHHENFVHLCLKQIQVSPPVEILDWRIAQRAYLVRNVKLHGVVKHGGFHIWHVPLRFPLL